MADECEKDENALAYITGLKDHKISDRFVDKIIDILSRCGTEELDMLFHCTFLVQMRWNLKIH